MACPDPAGTVTTVTGGQSNAANNISGEATPAERLGRVYTFFDGQCFQAEAPVLGASKGLGLNSLWTAFGARLTDTLDRDVLFIHGAVGGTQAADWMNDRSVYYAALRDRVADATAAGFTPRVIIWHQGETDAKIARSEAQIIADYTRLTDTPGFAVDRHTRAVWSMPRC